MAPSASGMATSEVGGRTTRWSSSRRILSTGRFQLIGIINDGGPLKAALYDPDTDRLLIVTSGDRIKQHTVTAISAEMIEMSDGRSTTRLTLIEDRS